MSKMPEDVLDALRKGSPIANDKLEVLRVFTRKMVVERAWVADQDVASFLEAGYTHQNVMEIVLAIGMKVLTTYSNHLFNAPLDDALQPFAWSKPE